MRRFLLALLIILSLPTLGETQDKVQGIIIDLVTGEIVEITLADNPKITYDGNNIKIVSETIDVQYTLSELTKVRMGEVDNSTDISSVANEDGKIEINRDILRFTGFDANEEIKIFSISGALMSTYKVSSAGNTTISLNSFPKGIYLISVKKETIKINKK